MSCYANLTINDKNYQTLTAKKGGSKPVWHTGPFKLDIDTLTDEVMIKIWKENMLTSVECIAFCVIKVSALVLNQGCDDWYTLYIDTKPCGKINLLTKFTPTSEVSQDYPLAKDQLQLDEYFNKVKNIK